MTKKKNIIVTGGAGFIGSHVVDALIAQGHRVTVLDNFSTGKKANCNTAARIIKVDICDFKKIKPYFKGVDLVFHLAALARIQPSIINPVPTMEVNVMGTLNVLLAARDAKVKRVVYPGSSSSYGDQDRLPVVEIMMPRAKNAYALSKFVGEELCKVFSLLYGLETVTLRYFNVYGPRQLTEGQYSTVVGIFLKQRKSGKPLTIVGDGTIERDFTYVSDVVRANLLAAEAKTVGKGEVINIGVNHKYSIRQVATMILGEATLPKDPKKVVFIPPRPGETRKTLANISKAKKLLGWKPLVTFEQGIAELKKINKLED